METSPAADSEPPSPPREPRRLRQLVFGKPRDLADTTLIHRLSLIPFLAWVGLGADGLSSSAYGPEEAYRALGEHTFLALGLVVLMATTVLLISAAYSRIIEQFPSGGGGYVVATKLLGPKAGLISGAALLVDYVLTITTSMAAAGDALFSLGPAAWQPLKLPVEIALLVALTTLNIRGVRESVIVLLPVFLLFLVTHVLLIGGAVVAHLPAIHSTAAHVGAGYTHAMRALGVGGLILIFLRAYSLGGGTYTGIEAVSNGLPIMREPRVRTAKRTMVYMGASLAFTASGLLLCYLLWQVTPVEGKTLNAVLIERLVRDVPLGGLFVGLTLFAEGALLVVAAQAGFIDGPRVLANMAIDSWVPHRFAALSDRLTTQNGIVLMGAASLAALLYTRGDVSHLIVMYSINVFLTFSLSMFGMLRHWWRVPGAAEARRRRRIALFGAGFALCAGILGITVFEKFLEGGWVTLTVTGLVVVLCLRIRGHYRYAALKMAQLHRELGDLPAREGTANLGAPDPAAPVAGVLVASYGGLGIHTVLNIFRAFPGHYRGLVFISVGVVDSGEFKGEHAVDQLRERTEAMVARYVRFAHGLGIPAAARSTVGIDAVAEAEQLCLEVAREYPRITFFAGKVIFQRERWYQRLLHNETALALQKRLHWAGKTMVTLPVRVREA
ncbi:MAG TPA: APC family permease [Gemmatimonadales bacterium]|nr:APC family permease [Gemmatimonadales bacterium]